MEYCLEDLRSKYFQWEKKEVFWVKWGPNEDLFYSFWGLWVVISKMRTISAIVRTSPVPYFSEWLWTSEIWARYSLSKLLNERDVLWPKFLMSEICIIIIFFEREYTSTNFWNMYIKLLILDISCQHFGAECKLEGFFVPFGHRVGECTILKMYICIGHIQYPHTSWTDTYSPNCWHRISDTNIHFQHYNT